MYILNLHSSPKNKYFTFEKSVERKINANSLDDAIDTAKFLMKEATWSFLYAQDNVLFFDSPAGCGVVILTKV